MPALPTPAGQRSKDRPRRTATAADRAVHRAVAALGVGGLARKPECTLDRASELRRRVGTAHEGVAVRTTREGVALPVVRPERLQLTLHSRTRHSEVLGQTGHRTILYLVDRTPPKPLGSGTARPTDHHRRLHRIERPPDGNVAGAAVQKAHRLERC